MDNEALTPLEQNRQNMLNFCFQLLSNAAVQHLSQQDMMNPDNLLDFHLSVDDHCKHNQDQWEWEQ